MSTKRGTVKKVDLVSFSRPRKGGIYAITLKEDDELLHVMLTNGSKEIMMFSNSGKAIRFNEKDVRQTGRTSRGIRGMRIQNNQYIVSVISTNNEKEIVLTATENGFGKRTSISHYRKTARGSQGVISISTSKRNGMMVSANLVRNNEDIMLMTDQGVLVRTRVHEVRETRRSAQGVCLINLKHGEKLVSAQVVNAGD